ncbi:MULTISPECIES: DUF5719 family protein [Arthrobacter]|uniref:DUF5719 family protein n=2 Tax=Arthrobacter TaxID=1663 RepID=A0ABU9KKD8_9MICC|nr:DUF5719 family protein [Arthrobacter sp. YJM1]MDP5227363.1 DUF5719 family protein [Arthrobacter sp. YJM1]
MSETTPVKDPRKARVIAKAVAGGTAGVASVALVAAVAALGSLAPRSSGGPVPQASVAVPAGDSLSVCPAPPRLVAGSGDGTDAQFSPESSSASSVFRGLTLTAPDGRTPASRIRGLDGNSLRELSKASPATDGAASGLPDQKAVIAPDQAPAAGQVLQSGTLDGQATQGTAVLSYTAGDGDLQGLAAASCLAPSSDAWLLGASTQVGRTAVLNLSNPGTTAATVNLELFGDKGQIKAPGSRGLSIAPGQSRSLVLAGLAPEQNALAVHVMSTGGPVAATIQQSVLRGLTPGGVDFIAPTAHPGTSQVVTGLSLSGNAAAGRLGSGFEDAVPALALAVPGEQDAVVQLKVYGKSGQQALAQGVVNVPAGTVSLVPLNSLPDGDYTVSVTSDASVLASARVVRGTDAKKPTDFAWAPSTPAIGTSQLIGVPAGGGSILEFGAPRGTAEVSYRPITADGAVQQAAKVTLAAGTTTTADVPASAGGSPVVGYLLSASGDPAYVSLVQTQDKGTGVSVVAAPASSAGLDSLPVRLGH